MINKKTLHERLIDELKIKIPNNSELVNSLGDILYIGKEAIYRRLRGEVPFSLEEASLISYHIGLSLDMLNETSGFKRPFVFKIANFAYPQEVDYTLINEFVEFLRHIKNEPDTEIGTAAKMIPDALHLNYPQITRFYLFKWLYQYDNQKSVNKFENVKGTQRILEILENMTNYLHHIKKSYYIFDKRIFRNLVDDIKYFYNIGLISNQDIILLKEDLFACLEGINQLATKGVNSIGNRTDIYLSNLNFEAGFSYIKSEMYKLSAIRAFTMYDISSSDMITYEYSLKWMQSLKRSSSLISESGVIERKEFIKKQQEIINSL